MAFSFRTDLAKEIKEGFTEDVDVSGIEIKHYTKKHALVSVVDILNEKSAKLMQKPIGRYVSLEIKPCLYLEDKELDEIVKYLAVEIKMLMNHMKLEKSTGSVLVAGIGNREITSDSIGPKVVSEISITRHLKIYYPKEHKNMWAVSGLLPGVMAQTGMETSEILGSVIKSLNPDLVIVLDALASRSLERINATIQLTDSGISPGSGLGNERKVLSYETLGVPVIAIGVPTVVDAQTIAYESLNNALSKVDDKDKYLKMFEEIDFSGLENKFVTSKNIDEEVICISKIIKRAIDKVFLEELEQDCL